MEKQVAESGTRAEKAEEQARQLQQMLQESTDKYNKTESLLQQAQQQQVANGSDGSAGKAEVEAMTKERDQYHTRMQEWEQYSQGLQTQVQQAQQQVQEAQQQMQEAQQQTADARQQAQVVAAAAAAEQSESGNVAETLMAELKSANAELVEKLEKQQSETKSIKAKAGLASSEVAAAEEEAAAAVAAKVELRERLIACDDEIAALKGEVSRAKVTAGASVSVELDRLKLAVDQAEVRQKRAEASADKATLHSQELETQIARHDALQKERENAKDAVEEELAEANKAVEEKSAELQEFKDLLEGGGVDDDNDEDGEELDENGRKIRDLRKLLNRERAEKLKADAMLAELQTKWKDERQELRAAANDASRSVSEHEHKESELESRVDYMKEREADERERVRLLDVELAKARDAERAALRQGENLEEQIADLERALAAGDRDTTLSDQIKRNQELESSLLAAEDKVKEQAAKLSKAAKDLNDQRTELERVKNLARSERAQKSLQNVRGSAARHGIAVEGAGISGGGVVYATPARNSAGMRSTRPAAAFHAGQRQISPGAAGLSGARKRPPPPPRTPAMGNPMIYSRTPSTRGRPAPPTSSPGSAYR